MENRTHSDDIEPLEINGSEIAAYWSIRFMMNTEDI
jgi:hypothetical protein